jgi:hypothetical protein
LNGFVTRREFVGLERVDDMGWGLDEEATEAEDIGGEETEGEVYVGELGEGELTLDSSGLWRGVLPPEDNNSAGVTHPLLPLTTMPSWSSAVARATAYSLARA